MSSTTSPAGVVLEPLPIQLPLEVVARILCFLRPAAPPTQLPLPDAQMGDLDHSPATSPEDIKAMHSARKDLCTVSLVCRALLPVVQRVLYGSITIRSGRGARMLARTLKEDVEHRRSHAHGEHFDKLRLPDHSRNDGSNVVSGSGPDAPPTRTDVATASCSCSCHPPPITADRDDVVPLHQLGRPLHTLVEHLCITHNDGLLAPLDTREDNLFWPESLRTVMDLCSNLRSISVISRPQEGEVLRQVLHPNTTARLERLAIHSLRFVLDSYLGRMVADFLSIV